MIKDVFLLIIQLITAPGNAWRVLSSQDKDTEHFLNWFLHPVFGLIALTTFVGGRWFARNGNVELALKNTIVSLVSVFGGYFIASFLINELAPRYGLDKNMTLYQKFVGYSSVALYAIYLIIPFISDFFILWIFAIYTLYIVYAGTSVYLGVTDDRKMNFTVAATLFIVLSPLLLNGMLSFIIH